MYKHSFIFSSLLIAAALSVSSGSAAAQDRSELAPNSFGRAGQLAFSSDSALTIQHSSQDVTTIQLAPSADYFIIDNLSIGGFVSFDYSKSGDSEGSRFGIGPRIGYNLKLSDLLSVWPKAGFAFAHSNISETTEVRDGATVETSRGGGALALNLFVPLMIHPAPHFFAGFGPFLDVDLSGDDRVTMFGGKLTLGGWLD